MKTTLQLAAVLIVGLMIGAAVTYFIVPLATSPGTTTSGGIQTIKIGGLFGTSGDSASYGVDIQNGAQVGINDVNNYLQSIGSNYRFQLVTYDTANTATGALSGMTALAQTQGIQAFLGPGNSVEIGGIVDYANSHKLVTVALYSSDAYSNQPYIFRPYTANHLVGPAAVKVMWNEGIRNVAAIYRDDSLGSSLNSIMKAAWQSLGGTWVSVQYTIDQPDYGSEVASLSSAVSSLGISPQTAVFHVTFETDGLNIYTHASTDSVLTQVRWFGETDAQRAAFLPPSASQAIGDFLVQVKDTGLTNVNPLSNVTRSFVSEFNARTGHNPTSWSLYTYDDAWLLTMALVQTGGQFGVHLAAAIPKVAAHYVGASGPLPLDKNHDLATADFGVWHVTKTGTAYAYTNFEFYSGTLGTLSPWVSGIFYGS
ncbi:MAG: penicillin-binding protein activator [Nitrososphaerales archaeon]|jgi:branched-chain amino acid transport system substrate-binding protein